MSEKATWNEQAICEECGTSGAMQWHEEEAGVRVLVSECPCGWLWITPDDYRDPMTQATKVDTHE